MTGLFAGKLLQLKEEGRYRSLSLPGGVDLTSNDYLGMASHPDLRRVAIEALENDLDIGSGGSRLLRGNRSEHEALEQFAAQHFSAPACLYFSSGFMANYSLITTLPRKGDVVLYDAYVHASVRDGLRACDARRYKFAHNDLNALEDLLRRHREKTKTFWICVESVYSMDGDSPDLAALYDLAERYEAYLIIDEAHGTGVYGEGGRGLCYDFVKKHGYERIIVLHTCGKAIGAAGGLVCASSQIIEYMINAARPFIYSTASLLLQSLVVMRSLEILSSEEGRRRREHLFDLCRTAQDFFGGSGSPIVPIMIGADNQAVFVARKLQEKGYDIRAVRPPTVPDGTARLRLSLGSHLDLKTLKEFALIYKEISSDL